MDNLSNYQKQEFGYQQQESVPTSKPDSNLVWAILCTVLCCMPLGIVSIVYSSKVDSLWSIGAFKEAYDAAATAKKWAIWGAIIGGIWCLLIVAFYIIVFVYAVTNGDYNDPYEDYL